METELFKVYPRDVKRIGSIKKGDTPGISQTHSDSATNYRGKTFRVEVSLTTKFPAQPSWEPVLATGWHQELLDLTNAHRHSMGLSVLVFHPELQLITDWKVRNCAHYLYMDHNTPAEVDWNFPARSINDRFVDLAYPPNYAWGENLAYGFLTAQGVFDAWMSDVGHRSNIENRSWTTCGMGAAQNLSTGLIFQGQDFGTYVIVGPPPPPPPPVTHEPAISQIWDKNDGNVNHIITNIIRNSVGSTVTVHHRPVSKPKATPTATAVATFKRNFKYVSG